MSKNHRENPEIGYETKDVNAHSTFWFGVAILVVMVLTAFVTKPLYDLLAERESAAQNPAAYVGEADVGGVDPPTPRLQVRPELDLDALRAREDAILTSYAWVDKEHGIARIPIREAMGLVAERGMPVFPSVNGDADADEATP